MLICDVHAHIYPDKIALKASDAIGAFYNTDMRHDGTAAALLKSAEEGGVSFSLVSGSATVPHQVAAINDFIARSVSENSSFLGLAAMHQDFKEPEKELRRAVSLGLCGLKLHPDFQRVNIDDSRLFPTYAYLEKKKLPVLFHTGDRRYDFSSPKRLINVINRFPDLPVIAAHFGAYTEWENAYLYPKHKNLWFDTSSSLALMPDGMALELIGRFGTDRFLFGTDFPMWSAKDEVGRLLSLGLSEEDNELIFHKNFEKLFGKYMKQNI